MQDAQLSLFIETPVYQSPALNEKLGKTVHFKMDCYQPTRSFKIRGMDHLCRDLLEQGYREFVASSGGNAGYSLAYAGRKLGAGVRVIVPATTDAYMQNLIREQGADVEVRGESWNDAHEFATELAEKSGAAYVHPFEHPVLWEGHATLVDECALQMPEPDQVVVAVGGGGLLCGVMEGMERNGWKKTKVLTAETEGADSYAQALEAGKVVRLDRIDSIAGSLGAKAVTQKALDWAGIRQTESYVCPDADAVRACKAFADTFNVLVEPACGAALSTVYSPAGKPLEGERILVIVCGGAGVSLERFYQWIKEFPMSTH